MDLDVVLLWLALFSAVLMLATGRPPLWRVKAVILIAAAAPLAWFRPDIAGWAIGGAWMLLLVIPNVLSRVNNRLVIGQRFALAAPMATLMTLLHPEREWRAQQQIIGALRLAQRGAFDAATARLADLVADHRTPPAMAINARMHLARLQDRWTEFIEEAPWRAVPAPLATMVEMRALASAGRIDDLLALQARWAADLVAARQTEPAGWAFALLSLLVGCGRTEALARLLRGPLRFLPAETRQLHLGIAGIVAGGEVGERARSVLKRLEMARDRDVALTAARWLRRQPQPLLLSLADQRVLMEAEADLDSYLTARAMRPRFWHSPVTLALIALNLAAFVVEMVRGGSEDEDVLTELGALWPPAVLQGHQYWRLITALFLHFGWVHVGMNMLALLAIGVVTERALGWWRMLTVYAVAGIGSMAAVIWFVREGWMESELLVGASGAIMGLVGALLASALRAWWRGRSRAARARLIWLLLVVALQSTLDIATPQISFAGHASGVLIGLIVALLLGRGRPEPASIAPPPSVTTFRPTASRVGRRDAAVLVLAAGVALGTAVLFPEHKEARGILDAPP